jgi:hypothetical protein
MLLNRDLLAWLGLGMNEAGAIETHGGNEDLPSWVEECDQMT